MNNIYDEIILDHNAHPQFFGTLDNPDLQLKATNSSCGDKFEIHLRLKDGVISCANFSAVSGEERALENVSKMPARVKCATLSWQTILNN